MVPKPFCSYSSVNGKPMRRGYTATCMWGESISLQAWIVVDKWKEIYQDLAWIDKEDFLQTYQVFESFSAFRVSLQLDTIKTMCYSVYDVTARLNTVVSSSAESRNYFPEQTGTLKAAQIKSCRIAPIASDSMLMWRIPVHRSQCGVYRSLCLMKKRLVNPSSKQTVVLIILCHSEDGLLNPNKNPQKLLQSQWKLEQTGHLFICSNLQLLQATTRDLSFKASTCQAHPSMQHRLAPLSLNEAADIRPNEQLFSKALANCHFHFHLRRAAPCPDSGSQHLWTLWRGWMKRTDDMQLEQRLGVPSCWSPAALLQPLQASGGSSEHRG